jgi:hypothetical protein
MGNVKWSGVNQNELLELHSKNFSLKEICLKLNITEHIVNKILKLNGLKPLRGGTKIDRLKNKYQDIIKRYQEVNKISVVAREFNTTESLVDKILKQHNIPKRRVSEGLDVNKVISFYNETHKVKSVADKFGVSNSVILKILHSSNIRVSKIKYTEEQIIEKYLELKTLVATCNELGVSEIYISRILKKHNIELQVLKRKKIGDVFGKLTIIEETNPTVSPGGYKTKKFILRCECGTMVTRSSNKLSNDKFSHCGCVILEHKRKREDDKRMRKEESLRKRIEREEIKRNQPIKESKKKYFVGSVKDKLTILSISDDEWQNRKIVCKCECGNIKEFKINTFYVSKSCGCLQREQSTKHGLTSKNDDFQRKWYDRWKSMNSRCYNPNTKSYKNYGGRGITVCERWREPNGLGCKNYIDDIHNILGPQPSPEHSLDRINNDGPYEINNLRWATNSEQGKNQRRFLKK